jgi:hypothetical protein
MNSFEMVANIVYQDGQTREVLLEQTGPGKYQANIDALEPGSYTISLSGTNPDSGESILETFGWSQSYSPEYIPVMNRTELTGQISHLVSMVDTPKAIFAHNLEMSSSIQPIWQRLIIFSAILLVLDITVRRIKISNQDVEKSWAWIKSASHFGKTTPQTGTATTIQYSTLLDLKQRRQKPDQSTSLNTDRSLFIQSRPVLSEKDMQIATKREGPSQQTTVATLLSNKREREKRRSI